MISVALATLVIGVAILVGGMLSQQHQQSGLAALSDPELLSPADATPEAQAFRGSSSSPVLWSERGFWSARMVR